MSRHIWLFFALTVPLTFLTLWLWYFFSKREQQRKEEKKAEIESAKTVRTDLGSQTGMELSEMRFDASRTGPSFDAKLP